MPRSYFCPFRPPPGSAHPSCKRPFLFVDLIPTDYRLLRNGQRNEFLPPPAVLATPLVAAGLKDVATSSARAHSYPGQ